VTLEIVGPDTITSLFSEFSYRVVTRPEYRHEKPVWQVLHVDGTVYTFFWESGDLQVDADEGPPLGRAALQPQTITMQVSLGGGRSAEKKVVFLRVPTALRVERCSYGGQVLYVDSLDISAYICGIFFARDGFGIDKTFISPERIVRDSDIVTFERPSELFNVSGWEVLDIVHARKPGSTYIVYKSLGLADSILVTVANVASPASTAFPSASRARPTPELSLRLGRAGTLDGLRH
jgi:hypothetical protein